MHREYFSLTAQYPVSLFWSQSSKFFEGKSLLPNFQVVWFPQSEHQPPFKKWAHYPCLGLQVTQILPTLQKWWFHPEKPGRLRPHTCYNFWERWVLSLSTGVATLVVGKPRNAAAQPKGRQAGWRKDERLSLYNVSWAPGDSCAWSWLTPGLKFNKPKNSFLIPSIIVSVEFLPCSKGFCCSQGVHRGQSWALPHSTWAGVEGPWPGNLV